jgi:hypothetical protein
LKAYDSKGNQINPIETFSDLKFIVEPDTNILSEDEILKYAPNSVAASKIKLTHGYGTNSDVLIVNNSLPWILAIYYVSAICIAIPVFHTGNSWGLFFILLMVILPLIYLYYIFNLKNYATNAPTKSKAKQQTKKTASTLIQNTATKSEGLESLKKYEKKVLELKTLYDVKEKVVRDLIEKRFEPPQITYDRFMSTIDKCHDLFYSEVDAALNITKLAAEDTPRVDEELESKIKTLNSLIDQIEDLTNELVINISSDAQSGDDVKTLIDDMENLIESVKEYS